MIVCIRGGKSHHPCPTCLIHKDHIPLQLPQDPSTRVLRTTPAMRDVYTRAQEMSGSDGEALLKANGLRDVEVCYLFNYIEMFTLY